MSGTRVEGFLIFLLVEVFIKAAVELGTFQAFVPKLDMRCWKDMSLCCSKACLSHLS